MTEEEQESSLLLYKTQLSQVELALGQQQNDNETISPDLSQLKNDLVELIQLTESSLLEIKRSKLLEALNSSESFSNGKEPEPSSSKQSQEFIDDEYTAFQKAMKDEFTDRKDVSTNLAYNDSLSTTANDSEEETPDCIAESTLHEMIGTKCRAPFSHSWGGLHIGNAMISAIESGHTDEQVRVIFLNPTHKSLLPCQHFLNGNCKFSEEQCRFSHGHPVPVSHLLPYQEPDHSLIKEGCRCLAKHDDGVWYPSTVDTVCSDTEVSIKFDSSVSLDISGNIVNIEDVLPLSNEDDCDSDESSSDDDPADIYAGSSNINNESNETSTLDQASKSEMKMGSWEVHTKGIGSKIMASMGYIDGQGLGKSSQGRAEPVPIIVLPAGKSLDKIMKIKELSGNSDLFNATKQLEKKQKLLEKREKGQANHANWGVFGFLNKKLSDSKKRPAKKHKNKVESTAKEYTVRELDKRSDTEVNVQILKTSEEIRNVERELSRLQYQLNRNADKSKKMTEHLQEGIRNQEKYLEKLKQSSKYLENNRQQRDAKKKLTIF